jgi:hypothetical protein
MIFFIFKLLILLFYIIITRKNVHIYQEKSGEIHRVSLGLVSMAGLIIQVLNFHYFAEDRGLICNYLYIQYTKAKCRHLKKLTCKGTLRQVSLGFERLDPVAGPYNLLVY